MRMLLRLDSIRNDGVGWMATFYGKPTVHGNCFSVPIDEEDAQTLVVGRDYLFVQEGDEATFQPPLLTRLAISRRRWSKWMSMPR